MHQADQLAAAKRKIRLLCAQQGLDDATRRALMAREAGVTTSTALTLEGAGRVLRALGSPGGQGNYPGKPAHVRPACQALLGKIEAQLTDMGLPWAYAATILLNTSGGTQQTGQLGKQHFRFATPDDLHRVIAALSYEQKKRRLLAQVTTALAERGLTPDQAHTLLPGLPHHWHTRRHLPSLKALAARLGL